MYLIDMEEIQSFYMERNQVSQDVDEQEKLIDKPVNEEVRDPKDKSEGLTWLYPSGLSFGVGFLMLVISVGLNFLLVNSYAFWLPGPIWIVSLISFTPWIISTLTYNRCLVQLYLATAVVMLSVWCFVALFLDESLLTASGVGAASFLVVALSLNLWAFRFDEVSLVQSGLGWCIRLTCVLMLTWYFGYVVNGTRGSLAIHFHRVQFILQPISIFGFGSLEILVVLTNTILAWWVFAGVKTRSILPGSMDELYKKSSLLHKIFLIISNPVVFLAVIWLLWVITAGVISVAHVPSTKVTVATVGNSNTVSDFVNAVEKQLEEGAQFVTTPQDILQEFSPRCDAAGVKCHAVVQDTVAPQISGLGGYAIIGCGIQNCVSIDLVFLVDPEGEITPVGKDRPGTTETPPTPQVFTSVYPDVRFSYLSYKDTFLSGDMTNVASNGANLVFVSSDKPFAIPRDRVYPHLVISAIENRVTIVRPSQNYNSAVIDPRGSIVGQSEFPDDSTSDDIVHVDVMLSYPLQAGWFRQQLPYWIITAACGFFLVIDIFYVLSQRRKPHDQ